MIIETTIFKEICNKILSAVDDSALSEITETLQLKAESNVLHLSVTNKEYFCTVNMSLNEETEFNATVNANTFLKLISKTTSKDIELSVVDNVLKVRGNGGYKIPLIFNGDKLLELPAITMNNITNEFFVDSKKLISLISYNSKEITKVNNIVRPVQKLYYLDKDGCITFTSGACVNNFDLGSDIKILLNDRLVKLFRLFKNELVNVKLAHDFVSEDVNQTKVCFTDKDVTITAILVGDDTMISSVPVSAIRNRANTDHKNSVVLNRVELLDVIGRLTIFNSKLDKPYGKFVFKNNELTIFGKTSDIYEKVTCSDYCVSEDYECIIDLDDLKLTLEGCSESHITLRFGDNQAVVVVRNNVYNVIPEVVEI